MPWKIVVGRWISLKHGPFPGDMFTGVCFTLLLVHIVSGLPLDIGIGSCGWSVPSPVEPPLEAVGSRNQVAKCSKWMWEDDFRMVSTGLTGMVSKCRDSIKQISRIWWQVIPLCPLMKKTPCCSKKHPMTLFGFDSWPVLCCVASIAHHRMSHMCQVASNLVLSSTMGTSDKKHIELVVEPTHLKNMLVKLDHFPICRGENNKMFELPPPTHAPFLLVI